MKAGCKTAPGQDVSEEPLERSRLGAAQRRWLGRGRHAELPCSLQPINPRAASETHVPAPARAGGRGNVCAGAWSGIYRSGSLAASSPQPLPQPWRTWGAKETQGLHISIALLQGKKGEKRRQPTPPSSAALLAGKELAVGEESWSWSHLQKENKGRKSLQEEPFSPRLPLGADSPPISPPLLYFGPVLGSPFLSSSLSEAGAARRWAANTAPGLSCSQAGPSRGNTGAPPAFSCPWG